MIKRLKQLVEQQYGFTDFEITSFQMSIEEYTGNTGLLFSKLRAFCTVEHFKNLMDAAITRLYPPKGYLIVTIRFDNGTQDYLLTVRDEKVACE